jgi:hypothetical protein
MADVAQNVTCGEEATGCGCDCHGTIDLGRFAGDGDVSVVDAADLLGTLDRDFARMHETMVRVIDVVDLLRRSGRVEQMEGLPLDLLVGLTHKMTSADAWILLETSRVLGHMPATWRRFREARLSWSQIRGIVQRARKLTVDKRQTLDRRIARTVDEETTDKLSPEQLLDAVDAAVDELTDPRTVNRREARAADRSFVHVQGDLFGGIRFVGGYEDPVQAATFLNALDDASELPKENREDDGEPTTRSRQRGQGLLRMADAWLAGGPNKTARPQLIVHVPLDQVTAQRGGTVELNVPGPLATITTRTAEILARDADMRAVIFDRKRPLGVSDVVHASRPTTKTQVAIRARDLGGRFPGERTPVGHCQIHHLVHREHGGNHDPDRLTLLGTRSHLRYIHGHGWRLRLDPYSGEITAERAGRIWHSLPWGTPLADDPGPTGTDPPEP